jgi:phosphoglycolate phosphatase-like HAD superfamily hydrolase
MMPAPRRPVVLIVQLWLACLVAGPVAGGQLGCMAKSRRAEAESPPPLSSWTDGRAKARILEFVGRVTDDKGPDFVPARDRIAVFDNDGTLWVEHPIPFQLMFAIDRAKTMLANDPKLAGKQPFKTLLGGEAPAINEQEIAALIAETHSGMTPEEFRKIAQGWLSTARHPRLGRIPSASTYQPQLELLAFLRLNAFKIFIVTGGGVDFVRAFSDEAYGIPPEQVVGSSSKTEFEVEGGKGQLTKLPELESLDDNAGKPMNINLHVGVRPIFAFGNSDGDLQMLQYTAGGKGPSLNLLVHHDDADREYAYDRQTKVGRLDRALDEALRQDWVVVSMAKDWKMIFP